MSKVRAGIAALHAVENEPQGSRSDGIISAIRNAVMPVDAVKAAEAVEAFHDAHPEVREAYETSKLVDRAAPPAPSLLVAGSTAIENAQDGNEADRVREYGLLAEVDAELAAIALSGDQLKAVIETTNATLERANVELDKLVERRAKFKQQRAETVDRIVSLNQAHIDNEAARLRRG